MNLHVSHIPLFFLYVSFAIWLALIVWGWPSFQKALIDRSKILFANFMMISIMWSLQASVGQGELAGMSFHLLGAAISFSMLGFMGAFWCMSVVGILYALIFLGLDQLWSVPINLLMTVLPGLLIAQLTLYLSRRYLPHHLFVYIFVNGFFTGALTIIGSSLVMMIALQALGAFEARAIWNSIFPVYFLLSWAEAFITGLFTAIFVALAPQYLLTYQDSIYLPNDGPQIYK